MDPDDDSKSVLAMAHSGLAVWVAMEQSAKARAFHALSNDLVAELKVTNVVNKVLAGKKEEEFGRRGRVLLDRP